VTLAVATAGAGASAPALRRRRRRQRLTLLSFLAPWLLGVLIFFVYPLVDTLYLSFTHFDLLSPPQWVGWSNYVFMFTKDVAVRTAAFNTLWLVLILVPARMLFGLAVATLVIRLRSGVGVFRTVYYLPALVPPVAGVLAFVFLFNPATGPVNQVLGALGLPQPLWFNDPNLSKPSLVLLGLWGIGDVMIIFLASLLDVPKEQYEAAALDGVNPAQRFRYVTLPNITPVLMFAAITGVIAALQYFTEAVVAASVASGQATTGGGNAALLGYPEGSTLTYSQWLYVMGFKSYYLGYASALAVVMFIVSLAVTLVLLRRGGVFLSNTEGPR
jgi:multiple sugar transport system permease protein